MSGRKPLAGFRVVDLSRFVSGSYAAMLLASMAADVIKVELPPKGDPYREQGTAFVGTESALFQALNLGKRSVALDPKSDTDWQALDALIGTSQVLIENGRPGSLQRVRLDAESVAARHPDLVYASISGYGQCGPDALRGGFDLILQAEGGLMSVTGSPSGDPVKVGVPALDIGSAMSCALGVVAALLDRSKSGQGARVTSSLLEFAVSTFTSVAPGYLVNGEIPGQMGSHSPTFAPYGAFRAQDGYLVLAGAGSEDLWRRLCEVLGVPHLVTDSRFGTNLDRVRNRDVLTDEIESVLVTRPASHWLDRLEAAGVPAAQVRDLSQVLDSPQVKALGLVRDFSSSDGDYQAIGPPFQIDGHMEYERAAPAYGEHTDEILQELGGLG